MPTQPQTRDFAQLLAGFASPAKMPPPRDLDGLEDDVATLSYDQALRNHSNSLPPTSEFSASNPVAGTITPEKPAVGSLQRGRRSCSITVRFSASEAEQLHVRAAQAGLTVSAYLRSCAFEVESLRAEVKTELAKLRSTTPASGAPADRPQRRWWRMFLPGKLS